MTRRASEEWIIQPLRKQLMDVALELWRRQGCPRSLLACTRDLLYEEAMARSMSCQGEAARLVGTSKQVMHQAVHRQGLTYIRGGRR